MELKDLEALKTLNQLDIVHLISDLINSIKIDAEKSVKGNGDAGTRVRKAMQDTRLLAEVIRDKIQLQKEVEWGKARKTALERAIEFEKDRIEKEKTRIETARKKRLQEI